jgi:hypothetical protein
MWALTTSEKQAKFDLFVSLRFDVIKKDAKRSEKMRKILLLVSQKKKQKTCETVCVSLPLYSRKR